MVVVDGRPVPNGLHTPQREKIPKDIHRHINDIIHQSSTKQTELENHNSKSETDPGRNNGLPSPVDGTTHSRNDQDRSHRTDTKQAQRSELGWQTITPPRVDVVPNKLDGIRHAQASKQAQWTELGRSWVKATDLSVMATNGFHQREEESRQAQRAELGTPPAGTFEALSNGKQTEHESERSRVAADGTHHSQWQNSPRASRQAQRTELGTPPAGTFESLTNGLTNEHETERSRLTMTDTHHQQENAIPSTSRQAQRTELGAPPAGTFSSLTNGILPQLEQRKQAQWTELGKHRGLEAPDGIPIPVDGTRHTAILNGTNGKNSSFKTTLTNGVHNGDTSPPKKKLILNAFVEMCSGHQSPGLFRHPDDRSSKFNDVNHWINLAKLLERGHFQGIFIADVLGGYDVYGGPKNLIPAIRSGAQWPVNEPLSVVPAMAAATSSIGFGVTISTSYEQPYHLARRMSTVDHLTNGRVGWNVVTGYLDSAARNLTNGNSQASHDERYAIAEEYMDVVYKLWNSSWRSDAVKLDRKAGIYTDPELVREINHEGKYFNVPGPHFCAPSPQRTPVIMQAGTSKAGKKFASKHAEAIFVSAHSPVSVASSIKDIRAEASNRGRAPSQIKFLAKFCPVLGRTQEEAEAKYRDYVQYGSYEGALALFGGWTGVDMAPYGDDEELRYVESNAIRSYIEGLLKSAPDVNGGKWTKRTLAEHIMVGGLGATCVGTPEKVADEMERWVREGDVDGFNIAYALMPQTFEDVIELLIPELRKRGLFWDGYCVPGGTYRENLYETPGQHEPLPDHPAAKMIWRPATLPVKNATVNGHAAHPKSVGFQLNGNAFTADAKGRLDFEETLKQDDLIDAAAMQLG